MSATATVRDTGRRFPVKAKLRAQALRSATFSLRDIQQQLAREGFDPPPSITTLAIWTDRRHERMRNAYQRRWKASRTIEHATFTWPAAETRTVEWKLGRIRSLNAAGMDLRSIAEVMNHDFPGDEPLNRSHIDGIVRRGRTPQSYRRQRRERAA